MITNKELNEVMLSPTKKDYYQIWNELMELADKISERWSPASTNESDPGIVLLKVLTAVADKLNYNIDKNTLEAFMPSATQVDSMRKLTEMMGYDMKHYHSATGKAKIAYKSSNEVDISMFDSGIYFPKFLNLKNEDEDINYVTLEEFTLQSGQSEREIAIIEGEMIECETNNDNIITALQLDDLNRYFLPEYAVAENGIFVTNIKDSAESDLWRREQNLNVQQPGTKVYKVAFDSTQNLPYVQFPEDVKTLIEDGLRIKYIRTNGVNGNIAAKTLAKLEKPAIWATADSDTIKELSADNFTVTNNSATSNGADPESLNAAYVNYKKTIGTFDTLVTCRDYMNKIYQMTESDVDTTPLVSNIIVSDIRDDINRSTPVCTFNEYGICYKDVSLKEPLVVTLDNGSTYTTTQNKIEHFDLIFYPFKTIYGLNNKTEYKNSFTYTATNLEKIKSELALTKNIAHNVVTPRVGIDDSEIACIKNYLKLKARITTVKKVTLIEEAEILNNVYKAIYANFNARQIDFGEEIPYETLVAVLKAADYRIKEVSLDEPTLSTKFSLITGTEEALSDADHTSLLGNKLYNKLALRNVLAGKIAAFDYETDFNSDYDKTSYPGYESTYPIPSTSATTPDPIITSLTSYFDVEEAYNNRDSQKEPDGLVLKENEVIQFRVPNFKTVKTYPAYVNYFIKLNETGNNENAIPATFQTLQKFMNEEDRWNTFVNQPDIVGHMTEVTSIDSEETFKTSLLTHVALFTSVEEEGKQKYSKVSSYAAAIQTYYYLPIDDNIFAFFNTWIKSQDSKELIAGETDKYNKLKGIYRDVGVQENPYGYLIDQALFKYLPAYKFNNVASNADALTQFYVQVTHAINSDEVKNKAATADGLGKDALYQGVPKDGEYQLKDKEYLLINYTDSKTDDSGNEIKTVVNKIYYQGCPEGDIIRANFKLIDSSLYHNNHSYSKKDGFTFAGQQPEGMFTLGTNEQIEIRSLVKVELNEASTYLYWTLNSDDPEAASNVFTFDENYDGGVNNAYTLKEGEYLYYTDSKKQDLAYYGSGSLIIKSPDTPPLRKYTTEGEASEEDIMTNGLAANIPWQHFTFGDDINSGLTIIENQYLSLTEGDIISYINGSVPIATNNWTSVDRPLETTYRLAEDATSSHLPSIAVAGIQWNVRSRLDFNMSKTTMQPLNWGDRVVVNFDRSEPIILESTSSDGKTLIPMCVNSNYTCQAALHHINTAKWADSGINLKLKISSQDLPKVAEGENLLMDNYVNGEAKYTKFDFANLPPILAEEDWLKLAENKGKDSDDYEEWVEEQANNPIAAFRLHTGIPENTFGLITLYYIKDVDEQPGRGAYIKAHFETGATTEGEGIEFFNTEDTLGTQKELKEGLNVIKLTSGVKHLEMWSDINKKSIVIFGKLDIIKGINPKLDYRITNGSSSDVGRFEQLLQDIRESGVANDFYYNLPIQRSAEIDLNTAIEDDLLSSPLTWYDPNNVNRKFVISEVDADYLATGITLTKSSRA
jgi:hypothetical protein